MKLNMRLRTIAITLMLGTVCVPSIWAQSQMSAKEMSTPDAARSAVKIQPLNIKPGLWETTVNRSTEGEMPIPPEMLNRMTPEQRARMEERMRANSAAHGATTTHRGCTTKEDLQKDKFSFGKECTPTIVASTSTVAKGKISCETEAGESTGSLEIDVVDQEHIKGSSHASMTGNGQTMNVESTFTSKWLGPSCGNVK